MTRLVVRSKASSFVAYTAVERAALLGILLALGLIAFPFSIAAAQPNRILLYCAFAMYLATLALPFMTVRFNPGIFHPLVFYVLWKGIQGVLRGEIALPIAGLGYHRALDTLGLSDLNSLVAFSFLLETVSLLSLYLGYLVFPRVGFPQFRIPDSRGIAVKSSMWVMAAGLGLIMLTILGGGFHQVLMQRGLASDVRISAQVGGQWNYLAGIGVVAPLVWLASDQRAIRSSVFWCVLVSALAINFASSGSRGGTILPLIMIGSIYVIQHRRIPYRVVMAGGVLALLLAGGLGQYRSALMEANSFDAVNVEGGPGSWISRAFEEMQGDAGANSGQLAVFGTVPDRVPYLWGESYLSIPFIVIPSALWGDKPDAAGKLAATRIFGNPLTAIPPGAVGEAYWNFSYYGVVIVFLVYGALLKCIAAFYQSNSSHPLAKVLLIYTIFFFEPHTPSIYEFVHAAVPALLLYCWFIVRSDGRISVSGSRRGALDWRSVR